MKKLALALALAASCSALTAHADTISLASSAANDTNNSGHATMNISPNTAWAAALPGSNWISFADTGDSNTTTNPGFTVVPNGTDVTFTQTFSLSSTAGLSGMLYVLADDTTSVFINGTEIFGANLGGSYPTCSSLPIGCLTSTEGIIDLSAYAGDFKTGTNTVSFQVFQEAGSSYGLDYSGWVDPVPAPEPGSLALLASGLIGLFLFARRRAFSN